MEGLGRLYNIATAFTPVDVNTANKATGKRVSMRNARTITCVVFKAAGTAGDDPTITLNQHTAYTGGTSAVLAAIDHYYTKSAATLVGTEAWVKYTQTAAETIVDPQGLTTSAETEMIIAIPVQADFLTLGYNYISMDYERAALANAQLAVGFYILGDLEVQRKADNLQATLA
jgi:hypothetical protein